jgi:hypothetical protein
MTDSEGIRLGIVRGISFGVFGPPDVFMPAVRALGSRFARVYLTWNEVEPEPGSFDWTAVDALLGQIEQGDEVWVTVVSASRWATSAATDFLPASPPKDLAAYAGFVAALVIRCKDRIRYWQCNNEPSNPGLWSGTAEQYAELAGAFAIAVRSADPGAQVVLGGCGFDVLSSPEDGAPRAFFSTVLSRARSAFDLFALHLYDDPLKIPAHIEDVRAMMRTHGYEREVVAGEYGGPTLLQFPRLDAVMHQVMAEAFSGQGPSLDSGDLAKADETADRKAMRALYARMASLPPELQMFMRDCPPDLEAKRHRIACREIVTRNLLALSAGVTRTLAWNLGPEVPNYRDPFNLMGFLSDKLALMDFAGDRLARREPAAETFDLLTGALNGAIAARQLPSGPGVVTIEVDRGSRGALLAFWLEGDAFSGEDLPPREITWRWDGVAPVIVDAFGATLAIEPRDGKLILPLTVTPILVCAA